AATTGNTVTVYWRVVSKAPAAAPAAPADGNAQAQNQNAAPQQFAFEDMNTATLPAQGPVRISRAFSVPAGPYDVFVLIKEPATTEKNAAPRKASLIQHEVDIP